MILTQLDSKLLHRLAGWAALCGAFDAMNAIDAELVARGFYEPLTSR